MTVGITFKIAHRMVGKNANKINAAITIIHIMDYILRISNKDDAIAPMTLNTPPTMNTPIMTVIM